MKRDTENWQPLIILGPPRSGTNMLRDLVTSAPGYETWSCDEINGIWKHGNSIRNYDDLRISDARPPVVRFIRRQFHRLYRRTSAEVIVEKTCANTMRPRFVDHVFPDASYLVIVRNGLDAIRSAQKRWIAGIDSKYTLQKLRYYPISDLPLYACRYLSNRIYQLVDENKVMSSWGPTSREMLAIKGSATLSELCALQWLGCTENLLNFIDEIPASRFRLVRYEDVVLNPGQILQSALDSLTGHRREIPSSALKIVRQDRVGIGDRGFFGNEFGQYGDRLQLALSRLGYSGPA